MTNEGPTKLARDLHKTARAARLLDRAHGPATLEERRALRDARAAEQAKSSEAENALAAQMIAIRDKHLQAALASVAARCESEDDARKRIRIEQNDRSRRRLPVYVIWLDGKQVWQGAFELGVIDEGQATWRERWLSYMSAEEAAKLDAPLLRRWRAEPRCALIPLDGGESFVAKLQRSETGDESDYVMFEGRGSTPEMAVEAAYSVLDAQSVEGKTEVIQ